MTIFRPISHIDFKGYTLIIPSICVGNVGQLCADLIINAIQCTQSGYLWHDAIIPLVGNDPYTENSKELALGAGVYHCESKKIAVVQIRSAPLKELARDFYTELVSWIKDSNIAQVVILTGSFLHERSAEQIDSASQFRYLACDKTIANFKIESRDWIPLERRNFPSLPKSAESSRGPGRFIIPGGGYAKHLHDRLVEADIPSAVILRFVGEGANIPDAVFLMEHLAEWFPTIGSQKELARDSIYPVSWRLLFGNSPPAGLY